ncbi:MAG: type I-C CRISPR-associated endonuclease Cas1c [candidate division Zixibacteria bacterium]|nr:type I-C CRISPR-associated endonuclease Cas1c [candidate division Zixibacteria bacterium]
MKHLLNTLYVTTSGAYLSRDGESVQVSIDHETKLRVPIHTISGIVCFGQVSCSPPLLGLCCERNVMVSFLSDYGRFWARVQGPVSGNVLLRREQYRRADDRAFSSVLARAIVIGKIANSRTVLLRAARETANETVSTQLGNTARQLARHLADLKELVDLDVVRGTEGLAAAGYFNVFDLLITSQKGDFYFRGRNRRPPLDNVNALLSFFYTLLMHDVVSALEAVGLDPAVGFLHRDRPGRPGLALDIMEELRPILADRLALSLINRKQLTAANFSKSESGAVTMDDKGRKIVLVAYQERKREEIQHPFIDEKVAIGLLPHVQAMLLARHLRGDLEVYPPFVWK